MIKIIRIGLVLLILAMAGAAQMTAAPEDADIVRILTLEERRQDENGFSVYDRVRQVLRVELPDNPEAQRRINSGYCTVYLDQREKDIEALTAELDSILGQQEEARAYAFGDRLVCERADSEVLSLRAEYWDNTGGPHPNSRYQGVNFLVSTGEMLELSDLLIPDGKSAAKLIRLLECRMEEEVGEYVYDPEAIDTYARKVTEQSGSWYLTEESFVVLFGPDEIAPYPVGLIEIEIPYGELGEIMRDSYLKTGKPMEVRSLNRLQSCIRMVADVFCGNAGWN